MSSQPPPHGRRSSANTVKPLRRKNAASSDQFKDWLQIPELRREAEAARSRIAASSSRTPSNAATQSASSSASPIARANTSARPPSGRQKTPPSNAFSRRKTPPTPPSPACSSLTRSHSPPSPTASVLTRTPPSPNSAVMRTPPGASGVMHTPPSPVSSRRGATQQQRAAPSQRGPHSAKPPVQPRGRPAAASTSKNANSKPQASKKGSGLFKGSAASKMSGANGAGRNDRDGGSGSGSRVTGCSLGSPGVGEQERIGRSRWRNLLKLGSDSGGDAHKGVGRRGAQRQLAATTIVYSGSLFAVDSVAGNKTGAAPRGAAVRIGEVV